MSSALLCPFDNCQLFFPTTAELNSHIEHRHVDYSDYVPHIPETVTSASTHTVDRSFETSSSHLPSPASPNISTFLPGFSLPDNPMILIDLKTESLLQITGQTKLEEITILVLKDIGLSEFRSNEDFDLMELRGLRELNLNQNYLHDISPIAMLTSLEVLSLEHNQITQISSLVSLNNLRSLSLCNNHITHLLTFPTMQNLAELRLTANQLKDFTDVIQALQRQPALVSLSIDGNPFMRQQKHMRYKLLSRLHLQALDGEEVTPFDFVIALDVTLHRAGRTETRDSLSASLVSDFLQDKSYEGLVARLKALRPKDYERDLRSLAAEVIGRRSGLA